MKTRSTITLGRTRLWRFYNKAMVVTAVLFLGTFVASAEAEDRTGSAKAELTQIEQKIVQKREELKAVGRGDDDVSLARRAKVKADLEGLEAAKSKLRVEKFEELEPEKASDLRDLQTALSRARTAEERAQILRAATAIEDGILEVETKAAGHKR